MSDVRVTIEEETGKIDLNTTSPSTLNRLFHRVDAATNRWVPG